jgi:hypothetical protein
MCNDYEQHVRWADYCKMMQALDLRIPSHQSEIDLAQADDIRINDTGPVMRAIGSEIELVPMTFALPTPSMAFDLTFEAHLSSQQCPSLARASPHSFGDHG